MIDVSTLGKLLLRGPQAGEFLDMMYPNRFSNLAEGRVRYGVMTSDAGRITDDGTICRLDEQSFYVTTTSSGAGAVEQWFSWWLADWRMDVHLTDLTQALCAVSLAGPRAHARSSSVAEETRLRPGAVRNTSTAAAAAVAGVPCLVLRIGFVGELGYEIHCPAAHGEHLWDALLEAGADVGIRPFGLEPQRVLRLQVPHRRPGHRLGVEPARGRDALARQARPRSGFHRPLGARARERATVETLLVGFEMTGTTVPTEGAVVVLDGGTPAGQVTSARFSPQLEKVIGLAWVPAALAMDGAAITISDAGTTLEAQIVTQPFYDPAGEVLRS